MRKKVDRLRGDIEDERQKEKRWRDKRKSGRRGRE